MLTATASNNLLKAAYTVGFTGHLPVVGTLVLLSGVAVLIGFLRLSAGFGSCENVWQTPEGEQPPVCSAARFDSGCFVVLERPWRAVLPFRMSWLPVEAVSASTTYVRIAAISRRGPMVDEPYRVVHANLIINRLGAKNFTKWN